MWDRPYALPTFLRMLVQGLMLVSLIFYEFSPLLVMAIIVLGISMILDPRDRPLDEDRSSTPPSGKPEPPEPPSAS